MVTPRPGTSGLGVVSVESDTLPRGLELFSQFLPSLPFYYIGQNLRQRPVGWSLARCPVGRPSQALWIFRVALQAPALSTDATMPSQLHSRPPRSLLCLLCPPVCTLIPPTDWPYAGGGWKVCLSAKMKGNLATLAGAALNLDTCVTKSWNLGERSSRSSKDQVNCTTGLVLVLSCEASWLLRTELGLYGDN